jgi:V8-like Glu-specific endopeptidase
MQYFLTLLFALPVGAAIYGSDDRSDVKDIPGMSKLAQAVAVQVPQLFLEKKENGHYAVQGVESYAESGASLICPEERFSRQPSLGSCTGFLVAPQILVTAGHCMANEGINSTTEEYCQAFAWIFDYNVKASGSAEYRDIPSRFVYRCKRVLWAELLSTDDSRPELVGKGRDFAIVELDRTVEGITPLRLANTRPQVGERIFTIGYPNGLPAKHSGLSPVLEHYENIFSAALDTLGGNSGGPVFNAKNDVVGILVAGHQTDTYRSDRACYKVNTCDENGRNCRVTSKLFPLSQAQWLDPLRPYLTRRAN